MNAHMKPPPRPVAFQGDLANLPPALAPLKELPHWVCWKWEWKVNKRGEGKWTKPPHNPASPERYARNNDPTTWDTYERALAVFQRGGCDGIGFCLANTDIEAFDIDNCRDSGTGEIAPEGMAIVDRSSSYTECTVSGTGLRIVGRGSGGKVHRKQKIPNSAVEVESYRGAERYIVISGNPLSNTWPHLADIGATMDDVVAELDGKKTNGFDFNARASGNGHDFNGSKSQFSWAFLPEKLQNLILNGPAPREDGSDVFHHAVCWLWEHHWDAASIETLIADKPIVPERYRHRLRKEIERCLGKAKPNSRGDEFSNAGAQSYTWPEPQELPNGLKPVAPFDPDFIPSALGDWVQDISDRMQCPPDFVAIPAMTALGSTIGCKIAIAPQRKTDWFEVPNVFGCVVGRPGMLKSPAISEATKPLQRLEVEARKQHEAALKKYAAEMEAFELKKAIAKESAKKAFRNGESVDFACLEEPQEPVAKRYIVNDWTYEKLGVIMAGNPNGVLALRDELVSLLKSLDQEENAAARGFVLTAWNGTTGYTFDRIMRGSTHINSACLSLLGSTQPGKIAEYIRRAIKGGEGDDGMIQRFGLLVWPDQSPEWKEVDRYPDIDARDKAYAAFQRLAELAPFSIGAIQGQYDRIPFLRFAYDAQGVFADWREDLEKRLRASELHPAMESHLSKYRKLVPGLALTNHLADGGSKAVSQKAILRAIAFAEYLETHARRVYAAGSESEVATAKAILGHLREGALQDGFGARDIRRKEWSNLTDSEQVKAGLDLLVEYDWLASQTIQTGGKPKTTYRINPRGLR
jgi:Protein of unknown function (DUF3987)